MTAIPPLLHPAEQFVGADGRIAPTWWDNLRKFNTEAGTVTDAISSSVTSLSTTVGTLSTTVASHTSSLTVLIGGTRSISAADSLAAGDDHYTIHCTGSTQYTFTVGAASGFAANFLVRVVNDKTGRRTDVAISGGETLRLYPGQATVLQKNGSSWTVLVRPGKWLVTADTTIHADEASGVSTNDGLNSGSPLTLQQAINLVVLDIDCSAGFHIIIQLAGAFTGGYTITEPITGAIYFTIQGDLANRGNVTFAVGNAQTGIYVKHRGFIKLRAITISGANATALIHADRNGGVDLYDVEFGTTTNGVLCKATDNGSIEFADICYFSGNCVAALHSDRHGIILLSAFDHEVTVNLASSVAFALATNGGLITADPGGSFDLNGTTPSGVRVLAAAMGVVRSATSGANYYPGNAAEDVSGGGYYN